MNDSLNGLLVQASDVFKEFDVGEGRKLEVLSGVNFSVNRSEVVAIVGESGAGKSTLLHLLGALDRPSEGKIFFEGQDIFDKSDEELALFRNRSIGFVFQFHHLLPEFSAIENVAMPSLIQNKSFEEVRERSTQLLDTLGLSGRIHHRPGRLSGGEKQRVAVARALMNKPGLVLADEPTGNLDTKTADKLHEEILRLSREFGHTFIIVTHNPTFAEKADRVLRIEDGKIYEDRFDPRTADTRRADS